jgi:hypothetical protein
MGLMLLGAQQTWRLRRLQVQWGRQEGREPWPAYQLCHHPTCQVGIAAVGIAQHNSPAMSIIV